MTKPAYHLDAANHDRDSAGKTYVYPVLSRRAGGISIGINLNPNNACNWRCIYCQVPDLMRGTPPKIDLAQLERELREMLDDILYGNFMQRHALTEAQPLQDIAFSGNGEPTSSSEFPQAVAVVEKVLRDYGLLGQLKLRLITNGSLIDRPGILDAIAHLARNNGETWFKVDAATTAGIFRINDVHLNPQGVLQRLRSCARSCPTWVQTCMFALDGRPPQEDDIAAYLALLEQASRDLAGVHLYGLARPSMQPEAPRLQKLPAIWLETLADRIRQLGLTVCVSP
jgi:wyosine [tRNA(Phe)-imidazoG37] synthetase (radical SAM superfamily)